MTYSLEEKVKYFAIISRLGIIGLQFVGNSLFPDHDAGVFLKPMDEKVNKTEVDKIVDLTLGGLTSWDAQYFLHIAHYGYTYENTLAFFPLFPLIIKHLSNVFLFMVNNLLSNLFQVQKIISVHEALILVSVIFNNFLFVQTAKILFLLSLTVLRNEKLAFISAVLFCLNPASIFFSATYSESLYCFLTFYSLLQIEKRNSLINFVIVGLTCGVRSNGLTNLGFLAYKYLKLMVRSKVSFFHDVLFIVGIIQSILPFLAYQFYCYFEFCVSRKIDLPEFIHHYGVSKNFVFPGNSTGIWCRSFPPFAYAYVQRHYWNVKFLNYYEIKQIPNFLLASPMAYIMLRGTFEFIKESKFSILYLGLYDQKTKSELPVTIFPYVLHGFALTIFAIFMIHVQVLTRLLASSSPLPYWFCAKIFSGILKYPLQGEVLKKLRKKELDEYYWECDENKKSRWRTFIWSESFSGYAFFIKWYFLSYFFVGTIMFSNFLPWT